MPQNYFKFKNTTPSVPKPNLKAGECSIAINQRVGPGPRPTAFHNKENQLICCWKPKMWTLLIGCFQMVVCTIGLATVSLLGQDKISEWLMHCFGEDENRYFFKWFILFLVVLFSNGLFWGFVLSLGAVYENFGLLEIWLIAQVLTIMVGAVTSSVVAHAYFSVIKIYFVPKFALLPIACFLLIGQLLGAGRLFLVFLTVRQGQSNSSFEEKRTSCCV